MKKIILFLSILIFFSNIDSTFSNEESEKYNIVNKLNVHGEKISLIEWYLVSHKRNIELFAQKYNIKSNAEFNSLFNDIGDMISILRKIESSSLSIEKKDEIITKIVKKMKITNDKLKILLKNQKIIFDDKLKKKTDSYIRLWTKVWSQLDKLLIRFAISLKKKEIENTKKREIIKHLVEIEKYSKRLKNFKNIQFSNENEMKKGFIRILKDIKNEMIWVKNVLKKES